MITPSQIDALLAQLRQYLESPDAEIESEVEAGYVERENWNTGFIESEPDGSRTLRLRIRVKGGASVKRGTPIGAPPGWPGA